jgi:hypothetical protein
LKVHKKRKSQGTGWAKHLTDKELASRVHKECFDCEKPDEPKEKWASGRNKDFTNKDF